MVPLKQLTGAAVGQPSQSHAFPLVLVVTGLAHAFRVVLEHLGFSLRKICSLSLQHVPHALDCFPT